MKAKWKPERDLHVSMRLYWLPARHAALINDCGSVHNVPFNMLLKETRGIIIYYMYTCSLCLYHTYKVYKSCYSQIIELSSLSRKTLAEAGLRCKAQLLATMDTNRAPRKF